MSQEANDPQAVEGHDVERQDVEVEVTATEEHAVHEQKPKSNASLIAGLIILLLIALGLGAWLIDPFGWFGRGPDQPPPSTPSATMPSTTRSATSSQSPTPSQTPAETHIELNISYLAARVTAQMTESGSVSCGNGVSNGVIRIRIGHNAFCDFMSASDTSLHYLVTVTIGSYKAPDDFDVSFVRAPAPSLALAPEIFATQLERAINGRYGGAAKVSCGREWLWLADGYEFLGCTVDGHRSDGTRFAPEVEVTFMGVNAASGTYNYSWSVQFVRPES